jgi:hypothetical protein
MKYRPCGHAIYKILNHLKFDQMSVVGILDTWSIAGEVMDTCGCENDNWKLYISLSDLLLALRLPFRENELHIAGNDAHYTLQAQHANRKEQNLGTALPDFAQILWE